MLSAFKNNIPESVFYMLLSALGFALMAACVKAVSHYNIPVLEIVAARALISAGISYVDIRRKKLSPWGNDKPWLVARGVVGACALIMVYYSVTHLPLAMATVLQYLHPVFTAVLAFLFLREKVKSSTVMCIILCLLGLGIMLFPHSADAGLTYSWLSIGAGILGALGSALAYIIVKKLTQTEDSSVIIFYFPIVTLPVAVLLLGDDFVMPTANACLLLVLVGVFTQIGQMGLTKAMHSEAASKATAYSYVQILFSIVIGWAYFDEVPTWTTVIGGGCIMAGAIVNVLWKR